MSGSKKIHRQQLSVLGYKDEQATIKYVNMLDRLLNFLLTSQFLGFWGCALLDRVIAAEKLAQRGYYQEAVSLAEKIMKQFHEPVSLWQIFWRLWQVKVLHNRLNSHLPKWQQAISACSQSVSSALEAASIGDFRHAETVLQQALLLCNDPQGIKLLQEIQRRLKAQGWLQSALMAEQAGEMAKARNYYQRIHNDFHDLENLCQRRLTAVAIADQSWLEAIKYSQGLTDELSVSYRKLAQEQQRQQHKLQNLHDIQKKLGLNNIEEAWRRSIGYIEELGADDVIQQILIEYIQPQLKNSLVLWSGRFQLAQNYWLKFGGNGTLHDWAVAAYYRFLAYPERLDWLQELLPIWMTATMNMELDILLVLSGSNSAIDYAEINTTTIINHLQELLSRLIDQVADDHIRSELRLQWQRETIAWEYLSFNHEVLIHGTHLSPGFYDLIQSRVGVVDLPAKTWALFYTPWWRSALACLQGDTLQAMQCQPAEPPDSTVTRFAQQFVAYYEGCYYLQSNSGGFPRWREAFPKLQLAKDQIWDSEQWYWEVDKLCDEHHPMIWNLSDRWIFANRWYDLLQSENAETFINFIANQE
jgi:hypothetical protein